MSFAFLTKLDGLFMRVIAMCKNGGLKLNVRSNFHHSKSHETWRHGIFMLFLVVMPILKVKGAIFVMICNLFSISIGSI